ncbi:hypothetical protein D3C81_1064490 [compost metagenome]
MAEIAVKPDHPRDVFRVVAAREQSFAHALQVRLAAVELQPGALVTQRDGNGGEIGREVCGVAILAVAQQMQYRDLLAPGPLALARYEGARGRQQVQAGDAEQRQRDHHRNKRPDDAQHVPAGR